MSRYSPGDGFAGEVELQICVSTVFEIAGWTSWSWLDFKIAWHWSIDSEGVSTFHRLDGLTSWVARVPQARCIFQGPTSPLVNTPSNVVSMQATDGDYTAIFDTLLRKSLPSEPKIEYTLDPYDVRNKMEYPPNVDDYDGIILTGSAASAYENLEWINRLVSYVTSIVKEKPNIKLIGICFGHQIIGRAMGGECVPNDGKWEVGVTEIALTDIGKQLFGVSSLNLQQMHRDHVPVVPPSFQLLGSTPISMNQGMVQFYPRDRASTRAPSPADVHIFTLQGHPEFTRRISEALVDARHLTGLLNTQLVEDVRRRAEWRNDGPDAEEGVTNLAFHLRDPPALATYNQRWALLSAHPFVSHPPNDVLAQAGFEEVKRHKRQWRCVSLGHPHPIALGHPQTPDGTESNFRTGMLTIRIFSGRGLALPPGTPVPDVIQKALETSPPARKSASNRESMQRKRYWWLPYVVLEFDKNEILVEALGGDLSKPEWNYRADFDVSRTSNISVSAYLRTAQSVRGQDDMDGNHASDQWYNATAGSGSFHLKIDFKPARHESLTIEQFDLLKVIGKGSFGKVMQVRKKDTQRIYALKTIRKANIASRPGEITHILAERTVLALVNNPFIVPLKFSFQTPDKLYLVMSFVNGGELFYHLQREGKFDEARSRFYAAELLCALEHLHGFDVVYRDLKPENILLDYTGHIALCDFGLCKLNMSKTEKTNTFCGTPEYIAPELLENQGYTKTVDWWTLGVLLYEMMTAHSIGPVTLPARHAPDAKSVIVGLLQRDPSKRLGANGAEDIKRHPFFSKHIDWNRLMAKKIQPPFKPTVESVLDVANFDAEFTGEAAQDSHVDATPLSETVQDQFRGFTYNPGNEYLSESAIISLIYTSVVLFPENIL
ncbi:Serine/threonine-protein kinase gad8 [Grifola frondosa]|uniref:non-specific serine/threonine protein kinase n=1 Tax=Grifola frondosa TaxID=5627 RepID=A0A1C7MPR6_GRIFR|nr:Serine/threonine-protein kinase gad8 [Grifola frondosa]